MCAMYTDIRPENDYSNIFRSVKKFLFHFMTKSRKPIKGKIMVETANKSY